MVVQGLAARGARFGTCLGKQERAVGKRSPLNRSGIRIQKRPKNFRTVGTERLWSERPGSYIRLLNWVNGSRRQNSKRLSSSRWLHGVRNADSARFSCLMAFLCAQVH